MRKRRFEISNEVFVDLKKVHEVIEVATARFFAIQAVSMFNEENSVGWTLFTEEHTQSVLNYRTCKYQTQGEVIPLDTLTKWVNICLKAYGPIIGSIYKTQDGTCELNVYCIIKEKNTGAW